MEKNTRKENSVKCNCKTYLRRLEKLQKKYSTLKNRHKILLDVTIQLTQHLEQCVMGKVSNEIYETLQYCARMYPDLYLQDDTMSGENQTENCEVDNNGKGLADIKSEKEYNQGFLARPKIPRTPQAKN